MTDKEKIEKLLQHICKFEDGYDCDTLFGDAIYEDGGEWCENHCGENNLCEECFRHFLLGE